MTEETKVPKSNNQPGIPTAFVNGVSVVPMDKEHDGILGASFSLYHAIMLFNQYNSPAVLCIDPYTKETEWVINIMGAQLFYGDEKQNRFMRSIRKVKNKIIMGIRG